MKVRSLEEVCEKEDFHLELKGNIYCCLRLGGEIYCSRISKLKDRNGLYQCLDLRWNRDCGTYKQ